MKKLVGLMVVFLLLAVSWYYLHRRVVFSHGAGDISQTFEIKEGEGVKDIAKRLEESHLIADDLYFDYYIWRTGSREKLQAGKYELRGSMTIPEIVQVFSLGEVVSNEVKVTFPEGTTVQGMADILEKKGFDKADFLAKVDCECGVKTDYDFLAEKPAGVDLEGFLFPDTYIFFKDASATSIINRMLLNFDEKITPETKSEIKKKGKTIYEIVTMASILEKEVRTPEDMKIASGIFWDRIDAGMPLQSCATIAYVLGQEKKQYSIEDTQAPSPYNTYLNRGLPRGPIGNPGLAAINAAIYPTKTDYNYFLTDPATGKTVFSKTLEEHNQNKAKYGL